MKLSIQKFNKTQIGTFCSFTLPLILMLQMFLPGAVLCFGTDGHIALENYASESCCDYDTYSSQNQDSYLETSNNSKTKPCGTCVDVRTSDTNSENKLISSNDLMPEIDFHAFTAYVLSSLWSQENSNQRLIIQDIPTSITFLDSLQTTVITC